MKKYFPKVYDLKYIIRDMAALKDVGLTKLSYEIGCNRIGPQHQAGSDSLLTLCCYFKMLDKPLSKDFSSSENVIFGIGKGYLKNSLNGYQQTPDYDNNYISPEYYYPHETSHYINTITPHIGFHQIYGPTPGPTPLYSYLNHHTQTLPNNYILYQPPQQHNRYLN
jgi:hypothetical protein